MDRTSEINQTLRDSGISDREISEIADMILGTNRRRPFLGEIIHWMVDADKLDYLPRDSHWTGFLPSLVQSMQIVGSMELLEEHVVFERRAIPYLESMVFAETIYYNNIHYHPEVRRADQTLSRAIKIAIEEDRITPVEAQKMTDDQIIRFLKKVGGKASALISRIQGKPLNTILVINWNDLNQENINRVLEMRGDSRRKGELERAIAQRVKGDPDLTIVDIPPPPRIQEADAPILDGGETIPLKSVSTIARALSESHPSLWSLRVYSERKIEENTKSFREFFLTLI